MSEPTFELWKSLEDDLRNPEILEVNWSVEPGLRIGVADGLDGPVRVWVEFCSERAFQCIDEGYRLRTIPIERGFIWRVHSSAYISAFRRSAAGTMDSFPLTHWLVMSENQCVDVISESEPVLRSVSV